MSQKLQQSLGTEFGQADRLHSFDRIREGMTLIEIDGLTNQATRLGTVESVVTDTAKNGVVFITNVVLNNGQRMTRRGWAARRLWKLA